jgi:PAS domain S-box-containing protein
VADQPTIRDATDASRPTTGGGDRTRPKKIGNGAPTGPNRPFDTRDVEIARLRSERDEWRARERVARAEVDQLHKRLILLSQTSKRFAASMRGGTSERQRYRRRVGAQYAVSRVLAEVSGLREAAPKIMEILGDRLGWEMGVLWMLRDNELRCESIWRSPLFPAGSFEEACRRASFSRGEGLPGGVWSRGEPVLAQHLLEEEDPLCEAASEAGLRGAIAFPVRDGGLVGVFELFRARELLPDDDLLPTVALVGRQIGQFVERRRAETERDLSLSLEREARRELSNILESISDAFFAVDHEWRFTYVNRRAEELWSRTRADLLGKNLWEEFPQAAGSVQFEMIHRAMKERTTTSFEAISSIVGVWVAGRAYPSANGGVAVYFDDVSERKRAEEEHERLAAHELAARAQAEERRRLSRELHDRVAHDMALVHQSLELHAALKESDPERAAAKMELAKATAKEALHSTRNLSMELRQPEVREGLRAALSDLLRDVVPPAVDSRILVEGDENTVPPGLRNQLFMILREAVRNAVTHSGCANIVVGINISTVRVVGYVEDDGRGFDAAESRWGGGIRSMRERTALTGAKLEISPAPNRGTKVMVSVPLQES